MKIGIFVEVYHNNEVMYASWLYRGNHQDSPYIVLFDNLLDADKEVEQQKLKIVDYQSWTRYSDIRILARFFCI